MLDYFLTEHPFTSLIIIIALATVITVGVVALPIRLAVDHTCAKRAELLETEYHYGFFEGCWIKNKDNTWVEYQTIRNVGIQP